MAVRKLRDGGFSRKMIERRGSGDERLLDMVQEEREERGSLIEALVFKSSSSLHPRWAFRSFSHTPPLLSSDHQHTKHQKDLEKSRYISNQTKETRYEKETETKVQMMKEKETHPG